MISAIPMIDGRPAGHFMKAEYFIIRDNEKEIARHLNPARKLNCGKKNVVIDFLKTNQVQQIITRKIGERALKGLLAAGINVYQLANGRLNEDQWLSPHYLRPLSQLSEFTQISDKHNRNCKSKCGQINSLNKPLSHSRLRKEECKKGCDCHVK